MFKIYIKDFHKNGYPDPIPTETLIQTIPATSENELRFISPIVKCEMGKVEGFDFSIEPGTPYYDAFLQMKTFIRVTYDNETIFYGRVLTIDNNGFRGTRKVRCEGPLSFLMDSPVEGIEETKRPIITTLQYIQQLIANHNAYINNEANKCFEVGNVPGHYSNINDEQQIKNDSRRFGSDSWTDTKSALEDLRSHYGGFLRTRAGEIGSPIYLDWMNHYFNPTTVSQTIEVGKNILDISNITEIDNVFTAIIPIGRKNVTQSDTGNSSSRQDNLYIDGKVLRVPDIVSYFESKGVSLDSGYHTRDDYWRAIDKYGMIIKTVSLTDSTTKEKLYADACEWIKNNYQGEVTKFTIKALDMHMIEGITGKTTSRIMVGDRVNIIYPVGKEDGSFEKRMTTQTCLSISYDLYHPENTSYTFGIPANILTKTYGIRKKTGSVNSVSTQKNQVGGADQPREKKWINIAGEWLMDHLFEYNPPSKSGQYWPYPLDDSCAEYMSGYQLYKPGEWLVYAQQLTPDTSGNPRWAASRRSYTDFDFETIEKYHVCEYVLFEYGIDIRTMLEVAYPGMTLDSKGNITFWRTVANAMTGQFEKAKSALMLLGEALTDHVIDFTTPDGNEIHSYMDSSGDWNYYYIDPQTGEKVQTKARDLTLKAVQSDNFIGSMVTEGYATRDEHGEAHIYEFGQAIENWYDGEVVIAKVDGDVIRVGSNKTQWSSSVAQKVNGVFLGATEYIVDPATGEKSAILIGKAGQASYRARLVTDKTSPYYGQYVQDPNGDTILTGDGFWDKKNLAIEGGVYTVQDPTTKKYTSYVKSSQLVIGDNNTSKTVLQALRDAGVLVGEADTPQALVANTVYANKISTIEAAIGTLKADKIDATNITTKLANVELGISAKGSITLTGNSSKFQTSGYMYASDFVLGSDSSSGGSNKYLSYAYQDIQVVLVTGTNNYKIQRKTFHNDDWEDIPNTTFSRAVTELKVTGPSNGTYTITPKPQGKPSLTFGFKSDENPDYYFYVDTSDTPTSSTINEKWIDAPLIIKKRNGSGEPTSVHSFTLAVNASAAWNTGYNKDLPSGTKGISIEDKLTHSATLPTGYEELTNFAQNKVWSGFSDNRGYLTFSVKVHDKTRHYAFKYDNVKSATGDGNTAYYAGYGDGHTAGDSEGYERGYNKDLPTNISVTNTLTYHDSNWNKANATQVDNFNQSKIWSGFVDKYGYLSFPVTVHGYTKTFYFAFDNRKLSSGGNTAYGAGYSAGATAVRNKIGPYGDTITSNGTYKASDKSLEGISEITISVDTGLGLPKTTAVANNITSGVTVCSTSSSGKTGTSKTLGMYSDTYNPQGVSGTHNCIVVKDGSTIVGRYDIQTIINNAKSGEFNRGWNECRAQFLSSAGTYWNTKNKTMTASDIGKVYAVTDGSVIAYTKDPGAK